MSAFVAMAAVRYLVDPSAWTDFFGPRDPAGTRRWAVILHVAAGGGALLTGLMLALARGIRGSARHRLIGRIYALCVIAATVAAAMLLPIVVPRAAGLGFALLAEAWLATTLVGWWRGEARRPGHGRWMARSLALTLASVSLRAQMLLFTGLLGWPFAGTYAFVAWSCWLPNMLLVEWWLTARFKRRIRAQGR